MREFKKGDKIVVTHKPHNLYNKKGIVIVGLEERGYIGIKFYEKFPQGHTLDGRIDEGYGWWMNSSWIKFLSNKMDKVKELKLKLLEK